MVVPVSSFRIFSMKSGRSESLVDQAISRAVNSDLVTQLVISSLSPLYTITSQSLNNCSFSIHLSCTEEKFSWCAPPMLVRIPIVGWIIGRNASISPISEMPASKIPNSVCSFISHTERGTPICEL